MFSNLGFCALTIAVAFTVLCGSAAAQVIYDNGPFITGAVSKNGTAAPAGKQWSEVQSDNGNTTESNTLAASGCQAVPGGNNRCADDFSVPVGETWTINQLTVYIIQIGAVTNPVTNMNLRVWNGRPGDAGAAIIFGDTTTNRFLSGTDTNVLRCFNSAVPTSNAPRTDLTVWEIKITVSPAQVLTAGTYWVDFQTTTTAAQFTPLTTYVGARGVPMNNARQFTSSTGLWANIFDAGNPAAAPDIQLDVPFKLEGSRSGVPAIARNRWLDFDGDNISDLAIARSTSVASPTDWWIKNSGGGITSVPVGTGVGVEPSLDLPAPADFDGDGKTDIAVYHNGSFPNGGFIILRSTTGTVTFDQFGQIGDDGSLVRDYDGDGKADLAVFRGGDPGRFYYRGTLNNPGGNLTVITWGQGGDKAISGDFDGDGKGDFAILRNNGGLIEHWQLLSSGGFRAFQYGVNSTDRFVTGDYDLDNKTDVAAVRNAGGGAMQWFVLKSSDLTTVSELFGNFFTDFPVTGDYDGDGRTDIAVWRSGTGADKGTFFIRNSHAARSQEKWGTSNGNFQTPDFPVGYFIAK